jgi:hypothetical protein
MDDVMEKMAEREVLEFLTEFGYLTGAAHGITRQVIAKGKRSLWPTQVDVFQKLVQDKFLQIECTRCGNTVPTSEIVYALDNGGLCSWCEKMAENDD